MDVQLPDGTLIKGVPDGITKAELAAKLSANGYDISKLGGEAEQRQPPTTADRLKAAQGGLYRGAVSGLLGLPVDTAENAYNLAKAGVGTVAGLAGRPDLMPGLTTGTPLGSDWISRQMERIGINTKNPRPDDPASSMLYTGALIGGGSMLPGASTRGALTAATGGAVAEQIDPRLTALGAIAPAAAGQVGANIKNAVAARAAPVVETFKQAGTTPSVGQATDNVFLHGLENLASKFPGGAGVMQKFIEAQQRNMGAQARTGVSTEAAGRAIEKGITGERGFIERTRDTWKKLDDELGKRVGSTYKFAPTNTLDALDDMVKIVPGAEKTTSALVNTKIAEIREQFKADTVNNLGGMPFEAIRSLRSKVGSMLDDALVTGIPGGQLKRLYGALSKDLEGGARAIGAGKEFDRQNNFYRARMERIESVLDRVIGKGRQPEDIFKTFMPTDPDQANKVRAVMRSISPAERQVVSEAVANRLGRARPGAQNVEGEIFSSETFLTNWNRLSQGAKAQLFPDPPLRENINKIARAADSIRAGKGIYANPSGTAGSFAAYAVYMGPIAAVGGGLGGVSGALSASAASATTAFVGAKMMTNPKIVEWLATPVNPSSPQAVAHLARLGVIYNNTQDPALKDELAKFIDSVQKPPQ